jgi:hypothetical protein
MKGGDVATESSFKYDGIVRNRHSGGNRSPDVVPTKAGNPGFRLEFIPMKIGAGMTKSGT